MSSIGGSAVQPFNDDGTHGDLTANELVACGLYLYVRNPMYLGVLSILLGEVAFFRSSALLGYTALWLLIVHIVVPIYEEPNLRSRFGASYERYCQHVRRWIPGRPYRPPE